MPRAQQSRETQILSYFKTADLNEAALVLRFATDAVKERQHKSAEAKARAKATVTQTAPRPVAPKATVVPKKKKPVKKAQHRQPAAPAYTEDDLNGQAD